MLIHFAFLMLLRTLVCYSGATCNISIILSHGECVDRLKTAISHDVKNAKTNKNR
jgi:hypothetical protein